jgi:cell wall-associated NlpC family hydrolase
MLISNNKYLLTTFLLILFAFNGLSQDRALSKVAILYKQENYRLAFWKADNLLNNPEYDTSAIPKLYKSMALLHIEGRLFFRNRKPSPWEEGANMFLTLKKTEEGKLLIQKNIQIVSELSWYLTDELNRFKKQKDTEKYEKLKKILKDLFQGIQLNTRKEMKSKGESLPKQPKNTTAATEREKLIEIAKNEIGKPYVFGGTTQEGFDCSGFTCYVYQNANFQLGRSSRDQYQMCRKIEKTEIQKGDLIFFNNGTEEVSHVGIIISEPEEPLKMIHSSTSKGIVITDVETSDYWMKKLHGFGTFLAK